MSAIVFLYVIGIGALVAGAAAAIEWSVQGRFPTRHVWTAAIVAAVILPPATLAWHARATGRSPAATASQSALVEVVQLGRDAGAVMGSRERGTPLHALRTRLYMELDRIEHVRGRTLAEIWAAASLVLLAWIVTGVAHWQRERREWEETELDGVSVHLSEETGPAVLGIVTQRIVLPAWARSLAPEYRQLMLAHECEHIAAGDPQRLALALAALVVMPWNPALWWCAARMRRAIEMDCDARVLRRHPSPREYGYLLLQVAARGTNAGPLAVPLVNLLRLPSELELRLCAMTRPRTIGGRTALAGVALAGVAVLAAFTTPVPQVARLASRVMAESRTGTVRVQSRKPRAWVVLRDSVVQLDSVTYDPKLGITHGVLPTRLRRTIVRDTLPSAHVDDSLRFLARALAERSRQVDSMRARVDSMAAQLRARQLARPERITRHVRATLPGDSETPATSLARAMASGDSAAAQVWFKRSGDRIDAAVKQYYPNLATDATSNTVIWFLADSTGKVVRAVRKEEPAGAVSAQSAATLFGNVDPESINLVSIRKWTIGTRNLAVAWIELKK